MLDVVVTGGSISEAEKRAYVDRAIRRNKGHTVEKLEIELDGDFVNLTAHIAPEPFSRVRRITGYLVGDMTKWNGAKRAEEAARVKHC